LLINNGGNDMSFTPSFLIGDTVTNDNIRASFQCGNMGGMRRSHTTNTLVIISDHTKGLYEDKWFGDELHYTGMGKSGDQALDFMQNKTLAESNSNGVDVHLFEALLPSEYIYRGQVYLYGNPYQETQPGEDGTNRRVWMFPVKLKVSFQPLDNIVFEKYKQAKQKKARKLSDAELRKRAQQGGGQKVSRREVTSANYVRDEYVAEYSKRRAGGFCQLCNNPAPFKDNNGKPYLECHHIQWLSKDGTDTIDNTVALCPNCHKKMHIIDLDSDKVILMQKASR
jgi:5-methylcytosine-specific restriction enzyme A